MMLDRSGDRGRGSYHRSSGLRRPPRPRGMLFSSSLHNFLPASSHIHVLYFDIAFSSLQSRQRNAQAAATVDALRSENNALRGELDERQQRVHQRELLAALLAAREEVTALRLAADGAAQEKQRLLEIVRQQEDALASKDSTITQQEIQITQLRDQKHILEGKLNAALRDHRQSNSAYASDLQAQRRAAAVAEDKGRQQEAAKDAYASRAKRAEDIALLADNRVCAAHRKAGMDVRKAIMDLQRQQKIEQAQVQRQLQRAAADVNSAVAATAQWKAILVAEVPPSPVYRTRTAADLHSTAATAARDAAYAGAVASLAAEVTTGATRTRPFQLNVARWGESVASSSAPNAAPGPIVAGEVLE